MYLYIYTYIYILYMHQVRQIMFKYRNREVVAAMRKLRDAVQDAHIGRRQALAAASPALMRIVKRCAFLAIGWWRAGVERKVHLRGAGAAVERGRWRRVASDGLDRWASAFVDLSFQVR